MRNVASKAPSLGTTAGTSARRLAATALTILFLAALLFGGAWAVGGEDAVSDNWVGLTVVLAFFLGLFASFAAFVMAVFAATRHEPWPRLWLPLTAFPSVITAVVLLEALVFE